MEQLSNKSLFELLSIMKAQREKDVETAHYMADAILCELVDRLQAVCPQYPVIGDIKKEWEEQSKHWYWA